MLCVVHDPSLLHVCHECEVCIPFNDSDNFPAWNIFFNTTIGKGYIPPTRVIRPVISCGNERYLSEVKKVLRVAHETFEASRKHCSFPRSNMGLLSLVGVTYTIFTLFWQIRFIWTCSLLTKLFNDSHIFSSLIGAWNFAQP